MELSDSHAHLTMVLEGEKRWPPRGPTQDELTGVLTRARDAGVTRILVPATSRSDAPYAVEIAEANDGVFAAVGTHPHDTGTFDEDEDLRLFERLLESRKVVAIGEIGLDYHYDLAPREAQLRALTAQVRFAREKRLPVLLHNRESEADLLPILERELPGSPGDLKGVFHSFCADVAVAERALALGYLLSFSGMITFRAAENVRTAAEACPLGSSLVETDSPYLAPVPHRGKPNEPALVALIAGKLAEVKGVPLEEVARATTESFRRLFLTP
jgi:TatD DNase family protein